MSDIDRANGHGQSLISGAKIAPRAPTKLAAITEALCREEGASIADIVAITGWKVRTIRGVLAGTLKCRHGLIITSALVDRVRIYRAERPDPETR